MILTTRQYSLAAEKSWILVHMCMTNHSPGQHKIKNTNGREKTGMREKALDFSSKNKQTNKLCRFRCGIWGLWKSIRIRYCGGRGFCLHESKITNNKQKTNESASQAVSYEEIFPRNFGVGGVKTFACKISSGAQSEDLMQRFS